MNFANSEFLSPGAVGTNGGMVWVFRWESGLKVAVGNYEPTVDFKYQSQLTCFIIFKVLVVTGGREL
jgi:hypothetical protein